MAADLQAIAIEQRWCRSCPRVNLPSASAVPWLGVLLDPPAEAGVNWAARRACAGILTGPVLRDINARTLLTCGVLVGGSLGSSGRCNTRRYEGVDDRTFL
jgi:hypothetical protein